MTRDPDLMAEGQRIYREAVNQTLAGLQLLEENLKTYLEIHFDAVRALLGGRLHFDFKRQDYQDAALGRLVQVFSKVCANGALVAELRAVVKERDHVAHQALLKLYTEAPTSPQEYSDLISEMQKNMFQVKDLLTRVFAELEKLRKALES